MVNLSHHSSSIEHRHRCLLRPKLFVQACPHCMVTQPQSIIFCPLNKIQTFPFRKFNYKLSSNRIIALNKTHLYEVLNKIKRQSSKQVPIHPVEYLYFSSLNVFVSYVAHLFHLFLQICNHDEVIVDFIKL
jgi:hypothetical protein